jgi:hypothetical protein
VQGILTCLSIVALAVYAVFPAWGADLVAAAGPKQWCGTFEDFTTEEDTAELIAPNAATEPMRLFSVLVP